MIHHLVLNVYTTAAVIKVNNVKGVYVASERLIFFLTCKTNCFFTEAISIRQDVTNTPPVAKLKNKSTSFSLENSLSINFLYGNNDGVRFILIITTGEWIYNIGEKNHDPLCLF